MPNMRTLDQDDRAKLARAYMRGGMAPYQAARQTGFVRVAIMQEAIKAMEGREAEEAANGAEQEDSRAMRFGPGPADTEEAVEETPVESADDEAISLPEDAEVLCVGAGQETKQTVYPFLRPGEAKPSGVLMTLQTERLMLRLYERKGERLIQVTDRRTGHYLQIPQQLLQELSDALGVCNGAINMEMRRKTACE